MSCAQLLAAEMHSVPNSLKLFNFLRDDYPIHLHLPLGFAR